ncbi:unnamed protein product [Prorocentrum cordatum]|uniref:Uncharacterized protein n=1 Tax=Prorocentrum cordatum TaxID=2364126 RepID=A0ABN9PWQ4_9DINO|nr:unnamed protein product [Polarella glacialis]
MSRDTSSSAFSGIGTPEAAATQLHRAVQARRPDRLVRRPKMLYAIEWGADCQVELDLILQDTRSDGCLFGDIAQFFVPNLQDTVAALRLCPDRACQVLGPSIKGGHSVTRRGHCLRHGRHCNLQLARRHMAGTSCKGSSAQGRREQEGHKSIVDTLAWIALRRLIQEPEVGQENVEHFPTELLSEYLGDLYFIDWVILDPRMHGWPCARARKWTMMRHRQKTLAMIHPLSQFLRRFHRVCTYTWREYWFLHRYYDDATIGAITQHPTVIPDELQADLMWSQRRAGSRGAALTDEPTPPTD